MSIIYNPLVGSYRVYCFNKNFTKYAECHNKVLKFNEENPPYRRILAWHTRKCLFEHSASIDQNDADTLLSLSNLSDVSKDPGDDESDSGSVSVSVSSDI